jgi:transcriptional regulator with XRE-family HTH domain
MAAMDGLSSRIRGLRLRQQRTLSDVAERCGFTVSLLSKIESGKTTPPIATLAKIAVALGVNLGNLLDGSQDASTVLTQALRRDAQTATRTDKGYGFHLLAAERADKIMQPFLFVAERGKITSGAMAHCGEEFVYVLEGRMSYRVGGITYTLEAGDSLYFSSEEEHDLEPLTAKVKYLAVFVERAMPMTKRSPRTSKRLKYDA